MGLRKRRVVGEEPADVTTRVVLIVVPLISAGSMVIFRVKLSDPGALAAAAAVLIGALLSAFGLLAVWRERLANDNREVDQIRIRALDEAVAHVLLSVLASVVSTICVAVVANIDLSMKHPSDARVAAVVGFGAAGIAAFAYICITLVIVINLLWDAYTGTSARPRVRH